MRTTKIKAISAAIIFGTTILYGAKNESLYMGNVGRINPTTAQVLTGAGSNRRSSGIGDSVSDKIDIRFATIEWKLIYSKRHIR